MKAVVLILPNNNVSLVSGNSGIRHKEMKIERILPNGAYLENVRYGMDDIKSRSIKNIEPDACPSWFERVMARDEATLRRSVIVGCAVFWGMVIFLVVS